MDDARFDALARTAATAQTRRQALKTVGGGIAAAAQTVAPESCTAVGHKCRRGGECCGGGRTTCKRVSKDCHKKGKKKDRCCGTKNYNCANDCDCCRRFRCDLSANRCVKSNR